MYKLCLHSSEEVKFSNVGLSDFLKQVRLARGYVFLFST